jgi:uncharacterized protein YggU (UPF0235/DUF167 family)
MNVAAPPRKGKANREIVKWLSKKLGTSSSNIKLIAGLHSTIKIIEITGMTEVQVASALGIKRKAAVRYYPKTSERLG